MLCLDFQHSTYFISTYFIYFEIQDRRKFLLNFSVNLIHTETTKPLTFKYQDLFDWGWSVCFWYFTSHLFGFVQANFIFRDLNRFFFFYKIHSTRNLHFYNSYKEINKNKQNVLNRNLFNKTENHINEPKSKFSDYLS